MDRMKTVDDCKKEKFRNEANIFLDKCISYVERWYDFDKSSFKFIAVFCLKELVKWDNLASLCENLKFDVNTDKLYDEFSLVREVKMSLCEGSNRVDLGWVELLRKLKLKGVEGNYLN